MPVLPKDFEQMDTYVQDPTLHDTLYKERHLTLFMGPVFFIVLVST